jgi:asparagine synthetase B (glutamine-hydrolysing)
VSDFLLDMRPEFLRALNGAAEQLRFGDRTTAAIIDRRDFGLVITFSGDAALWAPHHSSGGSFVAVAGRPVFDEEEWEEGWAVAGSGGLAAKIIDAQYQAHGVSALDRVNGNCVVIVHDAARRQLHLVTDRCGVFPAFETESREGRLYGSHPDVLARAASEGHRIDEVSLAEFVLTGTVTPPFSYYERIRASDHATIHTIDLARSGGAHLVKGRYFEFAYGGTSDAAEQDLAIQLAGALQRAVRRRTLPRLGRSAVALSGGLDSRVVLASTASSEQTVAFSCYDEPNREFRTAEAIARTLAIPFLPLQRTPDYYADHAEQGVRISGGMGSLANNHFLGILPRLQQEGVENLLTGCYCDYLFKGLPLNRRAHWLTRRETLAPFGHQFYFDHLATKTALADRARERWQTRIPEGFRAQDTRAAVFQVEARRTFPLCYEGDNQQRLVPQRLTGWSPPFVDRDVVDIYRRLPYDFKLNRSIFRKVVGSLTPQLRDIADANTGAGVDASRLAEAARASQLRLQRHWRRLRGSASTDESWPEWASYLIPGRKFDALWRRHNPEALDLFRRVLGSGDLPDNPDQLKRRRPFLFVGLLTAKLWMDQRA